MSAIVTGFEYHRELIGGREVQKPLPKALHAIVQKRILIELAKLEHSLNVDVFSELDVICGENGEDRLVPDITVARSGAAYRSGSLAEGAVLCVEIMSPGQTLSELLDKCERLHAGGTERCWVIWPKKRKAWHYDAGSPIQEVIDNLTCGAIELRLSELFAGLEEYENQGAL